MKTSLVSSLLAFSVVIACGGSTTNTTSTIPGQPPPPPQTIDTVPVTTSSSTFAVDQVFLSDAAQASAPTNVAWKKWGFDIDHLDTTRESSNVCTLTSGAPKGNQMDGDFGIDNAWGSTLVPLLEIFVPNPSERASWGLAQGAPTLQLTVTGLPDGTDASAIGLAASAVLASPAGTLSKSIGSGGPLVQFSEVYENYGTVVASGSAAPLQFDLPFQVNQAHTQAVVVATLSLSIHVATIALTLANDGTISGTISGVLDPTELVASVHAFASVNDNTLCTDASFIGIANYINEAADILADGTNQSGTRCTGISIGLGFHAKPVIANATVVAAPTPPVCE